MSNKLTSVPDKIALSSNFKEITVAFTTKLALLQYCCFPTFSIYQVREFKRWPWLLQEKTSLENKHLHQHKYFVIIPSCLHAFYFVDIKVHFQAPHSSAIEENNFMVKDLLMCCWKFHNIYNLVRLHQRIRQNCTLIMPQFLIVFWYCHYCCLCLKLLVTPAGIFSRLQVAGCRLKM